MPRLPSNAAPHLIKGEKVTGKARYVEFLNAAGNVEGARGFEYDEKGIIVQMGIFSEALIPWHRVLQVWDVRGRIPRKLSAS
jgi:hypothetical protein